MGARAQTAKYPKDGEHAKFYWGSCSMQGWRKSNEDAMIMETDIGDGNSLFAVFDGHGGEHVALFSKKHFVEILMENKNYKKGDYEMALKGAILRLD